MVCDSGHSDTASPVNLRVRTDRIAPAVAGEGARLSRQRPDHVMIIDACRAQPADARQPLDQLCAEVDLEMAKSGVIRCSEVVRSLAADALSRAVVLRPGNESAVAPLRCFGVPGPPYSRQRFQHRRR
jgi:hypothetical protein